MTASSDFPLPWLEGHTIDEVLRTTVRKYGDRDAMVFPKSGQRWTWTEFEKEVDAAARALVALNVRKGEHVAVWATNVPQWVIMQFATARIGAVLVTINPAYRPFELKYVLDQSDAVALFLVDKFKTSDYFAMLKEVLPSLGSPEGGSPRALNLKEFPKLRNVVAFQGEPPEGVFKWNEFLELCGEPSEHDYNAALQYLEPQDKINIQYTSGTTGFPKAATLSHRNLLFNAYYIGDCQRLTHEDRICIPVPFYHCFGCVLGTLACAVYGSAMIVPNEYFKPTETLQAIAAERATALYGVPTMFIAQLEEPTFSQYDLKSLRTGIMAGAPCPIEIMRQVIDKMGASEITIAYGQTEASPVVTQTRYDDPIELRVETVGRATPGVEVKIVDPATGETLGDNTQGEFCCRGHAVMLGYYKNPEATAAAIDKDGWLHTGDLAIRTPKGYFRITGRIKDMLIRGGENIYPREIEECLFTHPAIEQAAVVGVPDLKYGEEVCAWIRLKSGSSLTEAEVRDFCKKQLAHYKTPKYVRFVESFPQTVTGKIQKFKIRETMIEEHQLKQHETA